MDIISHAIFLYKNYARASDVGNFITFGLGLGYLNGKNSWKINCNQNEIENFLSSLFLPSFSCHKRCKKWIWCNRESSFSTIAATIPFIIIFFIFRMASRWNEIAYFLLPRFRLKQKIFFFLAFPSSKSIYLWYKCEMITAAKMRRKKRRRGKYKNKFSMWPEYELSSLDMR